MKIDQELCIRCGACAAVCYLNLIDVMDLKVHLRGGCTDCGLCEKACPLGAIEIE